ncbi:MAG: alpha/beta hydrolase [Pseudomonadota bacterium]|nr:alpha/beta hydrolase [Pseudomonadota bacterium]
MRPAALALAAVLTSPAAAAPYGPELQGFDYPYPVHDFALDSQGERLTMRFMDVAPGKPNGATVVLLHGKNFCAATWERQIADLAAQGYRVIAPDQIGFCKSSKPRAYQFSFQQLANNTHALLHSLEITRAIVVGHSTGGMLAARYGLMFPAETRALVLVNPIGLEDGKALGVPAPTVDQWRQRELALTAEKIRAYEQSTYYAGAWAPPYDRWVDMLAGLAQGPGREVFADATARIDDMIFTQPVVYEFGLIKVPTVLMIGMKDTTAIGKDFAPPEVRAKLGHYAELAARAKAAIPGARLIAFPDAGHAPQIQHPERFDAALIEALRGLGD